ncbi:MAG: glycoside hydrolase family 127 protein, partial [Chitinophagaceae bacterium]|nr:glycoside hydrolase family 127 protein [Chitinophagaceae bacterium]
NDCITERLKPGRLDTSFASAPIITPKRKYKDYTVENFALETVPGLFVCGSIYRPATITKKIPAVLAPNGHFNGGRYRADEQYICASLARMGAIAVSYDLFGWGESRLQVREDDHYRPIAMKIQRLNTEKILNYILSLPETDTSLIGITGASGGGSQTMLNTALDKRIKVSVPVVMLSADYPGGCPCETGTGIHKCEGGTNNAEIAAMAAPRSQLVISDGNDWTSNVPQKEYPYLQKIYALYGKTSLVKNVHFKDEGHDYGFSKRKAMYPFMAQYLKLNIKAITNKNGEIDESGATIEDEPLLLVFGENGNKLPARALKNIREVTLALGEPVIDKPLYTSLPLNAVKPGGWLLRQLQVMRDGSTGHLDEVYDKLKNDNGWLGGKGDGWEETPYWLDGATPLAYLLDDTTLQNKVLKYINWTIDHQRPSGYFGPITDIERKNKELKADNCEYGEDWWPKMVMLKVLQQYYSATNDQRVISFMSKYFRYQLDAIGRCQVGKWNDWSKARGVDNIMVINWLYNITKEDFL